MDHVEITVEVMGRRHTVRRPIRVDPDTGTIFASEALGGAFADMATVGLPPFEREAFIHVI